MQIRALSSLECSKVLAESRLARLACVKDERPYIVPIYFAYANNHLYSFSMPGQKIVWMRSNPHVCVQVSERGTGPRWKSVIVHGHYEELDDSPLHRQERERAWRLLSTHADWWEPGSLRPSPPSVSDHYDHVFFRIHIEEISGREAG